MVSESLSHQVSARRGGGKASLDPGFHWEAIHVPRRLENSTAAIIVRTMLGPAMVSATYEIRMTVAANDYVRGRLRRPKSKVETRPHRESRGR